MKHQLTLALGALLFLSTWAIPASAIESCHDGKACKAGTTCMGSVCVPDAMICTSDAGCASYEKCDFTCPHGATVSVTRVDGGTSSNSTDPAPSTDAKEGGGSSGSSGSSGGSSGAPLPPDGEKDAQQPPPDANVTNSCPKDKGMCVIELKKVPVDAGCQAFCQVVGKCGFDQGTASSGSGTATSGSSPGKATEPMPPPKEGEGSGGADVPAPAPDGEGGAEAGGSGASDEQSGTDEDDEAPGFAETPAPDGGKDAPNTNMPEPKTSEEQLKQNIEACATMCSVWKLKNVATSELNALQACVANFQSQTCDDIEKNCDAQAKSWDKAVKAGGDDWSLSLGGGWGFSGGSAASDLSKGESGNQNTAAPAAAGTDATGGSSAAGGGSAGGCTASPVAPGQGAAALVLLMLGALVLRRRMTV